MIWWIIIRLNMTLRCISIWITDQQSRAASERLTRAMSLCISIFPRQITMPRMRKSSLKPVRLSSMPSSPVRWWSRSRTIFGVRQTSTPRRLTMKRLRKPFPRQKARGCLLRQRGSTHLQRQWGICMGCIQCRKCWIWNY